MALNQRQIPGGAYLNEVDTTQRQVPGHQYVNETSSAAAAATNLPAPVNINQAVNRASTF